MNWVGVVLCFCEGEESGKGTYMVRFWCMGTGQYIWECNCLTKTSYSKVMRLGKRYHCSSTTNVVHDRQASKNTTRKRWKWSDVEEIHWWGCIHLSRRTRWPPLLSPSPSLPILLSLLLPPLSLSGTASWCWFFIALGFFISVAG